MATLSLTSARWSPERIFYLTMTLGIVLTVYVGFARSFFLRPLFPAWPSPAEPIFYLHGRCSAPGACCSWSRARS
jgi:formate-dependent nitrite reductase membrane component NrfD